MSDDRDTYDATKARLEDIVVAVRRKDTSLEKSIDLLEEGVRLANLCTEQVDAVGSALETMSGPQDADTDDVAEGPEDAAAVEAPSDGAAEDEAAGSSPEQA